MLTVIRTRTFLDMRRNLARVLGDQRMGRSSIIRAEGAHNTAATSHGRNELSRQPHSDLLLPKVKWGMSVYTPLIDEHQPAPDDLRQRQRRRRHDQHRLPAKRSA